MEEMKKHPALGARMVSGAGLDDIASWILAHHERPDGRGYPFGLDDDQIPFEAKILAVCDSYEAMTADRIYSPPMPPELAKQELVELSGAQFDPQVVQALVAALAAGERDEAELLQAV